MDSRASSFGDVQMLARTMTKQIYMITRSCFKILGPAGNRRTKVNKHKHDNRASQLSIRKGGLPGKKNS